MVVTGMEQVVLYRLLRLDVVVPCRLQGVALEQALLQLRS
jgi:hypothetical protein